MRVVRSVITTKFTTIWALPIIWSININLPKRFENKDFDNSKLFLTFEQHYFSDFLSSRAFIWCCFLEVGLYATNIKLYSTFSVSHASKLDISHINWTSKNLELEFLEIWERLKYSPTNLNFWEYHLQYLFPLISTPVAYLTLKL